MFGRDKSRKSNEKMATNADWHGWAPTPDTPAASVSFLSAERPPAAQNIALGPGESVLGLLPTAQVKAKQTATARIELLPTCKAHASLRAVLIRNGNGDDKKAYFKSFVKLKDTPTVITVGGKFGSSHSALRVELKNVGTAPVEFIAKRPSIVIV